MTADLSRCARVSDPAHRLTEGLPTWGQHWRPVGLQQRRDRETGAEQDSSAAPYMCPRRRRMRKSQNRVGRLPAPVQVSINCRLRDGWKLSTIAEWLFAEKATQEVPDLDLHPGDPYALAWTRTAKSQSVALATCKNS